MDRAGIDVDGRDAVTESGAADLPAVDARDGTTDLSSPCATCPAGLSCGGGGVPEQCGITLTPRPGKVCSPDGWCFVSPVPQRNDLLSVYASAWDDVWAVGRAGTVIHFDGTAWSGTTGLLWEMGGLPPESSGTVPLGNNVATFNAVWASGPSDVWIAGIIEHANPTPILVRGDGVHWNAITIPNVAEPSFTSVWGTGPDDVWVLGGKQRGVHHWNGTTWTTTTLPADRDTDRSFAIWAGSAKDVLVGTERGLFQFDGSTWQATSITSGVRGVWGSPTAGKWAWLGSRLWHLVGNTWEESKTPGCGTAFWAASDTSIWCGGSYFDGVKWNNPNRPGSSLELNAIYGTKSGAALGVANHGRVYDLTPTSATLYKGADPGIVVRDIQSSGADNVWLAGYGEHAKAVRWDGKAFTSHEESSVEEFVSVSVSPEGSAWLGDSAGKMWQLSGSTLVPSSSGVASVAGGMWAAASDAVWAVNGTDATISMYNGNGWQTAAHPLSTSTRKLVGIWGLGRNDVWVVGSNGTAEHWNGSTWKNQSMLGPGNDLTDVWGWSATHVWATSSNSVYEWNGAEWSSVHWMVYPINGLHGCSSSEIWVPGSSGSNEQLYFFDGSQWTLSNLGVTYLNSSPRVWCAAPGDAWLLEGTSILHRQVP